jgi:hypothetical protein
MYKEVERFYRLKYGKTVGALKFKLYLLRKKQKRSNKTETVRTRRVNLFIF